MLQNIKFDKSSIAVIIFILVIIYGVGVKFQKPDRPLLPSEEAQENFNNWRPRRPWRPWRGPWSRPWRGNMYYPMRYPWYKSWMWENPYVYMNNPGCDNQACGGYCQPWNSKCCGGTKPFTCNSLSCKNNPLCN